ncbi:MAG: PEP-CTERM sorting domain-containing protein [Gemmatales bacterium]
MGYSNTTNFSGFAFANGGGGVIGANTITRLAADNIFFDPTINPGNSIVGFTFSVANLNTAAVSARARVRFYNNNAGVPGTVIAGFSFAPISFTASQVSLFSATIAAGTVFVPPAGTPLWVGITFDNNNGGTGATLAQLNNLGQGIYNPPTIGSSTDNFFLTTTFGDFLSSNPAGALTNFGGTPVASFGWAFTVSVPEPTTWALIGVSVLGAGYGMRRFHLRRAAQLDCKLKR